jgi:6,7-dimethyl-8-ribityllumazine synthase
MPKRHYRTLDRLIQQANQASARKPGTVEMLAAMIKLATDDGADPYLVLGVLVEGAVHTLDKHIPKERRAEATEQFGQLLVERLKARGLA